MGTRHYLAIKLRENDYRIVYGQHDGHPEFAGYKLIKSVHRILSIFKQLDKEQEGIKALVDNWDSIATTLYYGFETIDCCPEYSESLVLGEEFKDFQFYQDKYVRSPAYLFERLVGSIEQSVLESGKLNLGVEDIFSNIFEYLKKNPVYFHDGHETTFNSDLEFGYILDLTQSTNIELHTMLPKGDFIDLSDLNRVDLKKQDLSLYKYLVENAKNLFSKNTGCDTVISFEKLAYLELNSELPFNEDYSKGLQNLKEAFKRTGHEDLASEIKSLLEFQRALNVVKNYSLKEVNDEFIPKIRDFLDLHKDLEFEVGPFVYNTLKSYSRRNWESNTRMSLVASYHITPSISEHSLDLTGYKELVYSRA